MFGRFSRPGARRQTSAGDSSDDATGVYERLRAQALNAFENELVAVGGDGADPLGLVVDVPAGNGGFATLVALRGDTASLYLSTGGGVIGAGGNKAVATRVALVLAVSRDHLDEFRPESDTSHPSPSLVRFFALTSSGRRVAEAPVDAFWGKQQHDLMPLITVVQGLITAIRQVSAAS